MRVEQLGTHVKDAAASTSLPLYRLLMKKI